MPNNKVFIPMSLSAYFLFTTTPEMYVSHNIGVHYAKLYSRKTINIEYPGRVCSSLR